MMRSVLAWLEEAAGRAPDALAADAPDARYTWAQMLRRARQIGTAIARVAPAQAPVLILMEKSPDCIAAMLGAAFANCPYTPLDASMPTARMKRIASTLAPAVVLCERRHEQAACELAGGVPVLVAETLAQEEDAALLDRRRAEQIDTDLLYVLFTSGSTGEPKGVAIAHRGVIDLVEWACGALRLPEGVRFGSQAPFYFDNSVLDIFCAMRMAGSLCLIPRGDFLFPKRLLRTLQEQQVNTLFWVPSALTALADVLMPDCLPQVKRVFFCGEVMPCATLNRWRRALPEADYVNMYGPTEITDVCCYYRVDRAFSDADSLPIGRPCANMRVVLVEGELCVAGTGVSPGYYNAPDRTAAAFIRNPLRPQVNETLYRTGDMAAYNERGELMFLGRRDRQIKRSGYRIELGEIECALGAAPGVTLCCCWYEPEDERILAAYTGSATEKEVRAALRAALPKYMLPDALYHRETLPHTGSGKIDRRTLAQEVAREQSVL